MKAPVASRARGLGFNMTPMIDVVFLLIIFFLVSSHLARQEVDVQLALPEAVSADDPWEDQSPRVTVNVLASGELRLSGQRIDMAELGRVLRVENLRERGGDLQVRIRADRQVPYEHVEPILGLCADVGVWNVNFVVLGIPEG